MIYLLSGIVGACAAGILDVYFPEAPLVVHHVVFAAVGVVCGALAAHRLQEPTR